MERPAATGDLDCLARFTHENLARLATAMRELNARLRAEGLSDAESIELTGHLRSPEFFGRGEITTWMTDAERSTSSATCLPETVPGSATTH
jgi:hypothetical protein